MIELAAAAGSAEPVRLRDIAQRHQIPQQFLVQILLQLKAAGLVTSTRGASGGYQLARLAEQITLAEIVAVSEGAAESPRPAQRESPAARVLHHTWQRLADQQQQLLAEFNLADLAARVRQQGTAAMYYI